VAVAGELGGDLVLRDAVQDEHEGALALVRPPRVVEDPGVILARMRGDREASCTFRGGARRRTMSWTTRGGRLRRNSIRELRLHGVLAGLALAGGPVTCRRRHVAVVDVLRPARPGARSRRSGPVLLARAHVITDDASNSVTSTRP
jgi:hypothetical protein